MASGLIQQKNSLGVSNATALKTSTAAGVIGALGGAFSGFYSARSTKAALSAQQYALRNQAQIKLLENERRQKYMNESYATRYWQLGYERDTSVSTQKVAAASQGFAGSQPTDQSIYIDTANKYNEAQNNIARELQLNSFESNLNTASQVSSLLSGARIAGIQEHSVSTLSSTVAGGLSGFAESFSNSLGIMGGFGTSEIGTSESSISEGWSKGLNPSKPDIYSGKLNLDPFGGLKW